MYISRMKVLVTGANGLLGNNLVRELLSRNHQVSVLLQKATNPAPGLNQLPIQRFFGDLLDPIALEAAVQGHERVIHAAASTQVYPPRSPSILETNVQGTENIVQACLKADVKRLIHIGTANSFGPGTPSRPGNESSPYQGDWGLDYIRSKYLAQEKILDAVKNRGLRALVLNPTFMIGPYDTTPSSGALVLALYQRKIPGYSAGSKCYIAVKDVAVAAANALHQGRDGECYILGNHNLTHRDAFEILGRAMGVQGPILPLPGVLVQTMGALGSILANWTHRPPKLTLEITRISCGHHCYSSQKAQRELGLPCTDLDTAARECLQWFQQNGYTSPN